VVSRTEEWRGLLGTMYNCSDLPVNLICKYEWFSRAIGKWPGSLQIFLFCCDAATQRG